MIVQAPSTFRTVHVGDDAKNHQSLLKEPPRPGPPVTGPGHMTNEVVTSKVSVNRKKPTTRREAGCQAMAAFEKENVAQERFRACDEPRLGLILQECSETRWLLLKRKTEVAR